MMAQKKKKPIRGCFSNPMGRGSVSFRVKFGKQYLFMNKRLSLVGSFEETVSLQGIVL